MELAVDLENLVQILVDHLQEINPKFEFTSFYSDDFINGFRDLVKDQDRFTTLLTVEKITVEEFIKIGVYLAPHCFTTHLIKFIRRTYLNLDPTLPKRIKYSKRAAKSNTES